MSGHEQKKPLSLSLRTKTVLIFVGLFVLMILALWLINRFGLKAYYLKQQLVRMEETRTLLTELAGKPNDEDLEMELNLACERYGITMLLMGSDVILYSAGEEERGLWRRLEMEQDLMRAMDKVYVKTDDYMIYQTRDPMTRSEQIVCVGLAKSESEENCPYLLSLSLARIEESTQLSNRFLLLIGLGILLIGSLLMLLFTKRLTDPIITLSSLSKKMAALDFSERFQGDSGDEIQILGENINELSDNLELTIGDLKKANQQLERDVQEKERQNEQQKEFLSNISHELKTPIALIRGYAEGLRDGLCEDEELRGRYSDIIIDEAERMNRLVRLLLNLNELESGAARIEKSRFDLSALIRDIAASYQIESEQAGAQLQMDIPDTLPVESDELLTEQIVQNYLSNAFHYVKKNGLVRVSAKQKGETGALISVYNEGDPIPETALTQIWNKFYKVDKARTRSYGGSGIGLSLVKASAERLGGGCEVKNTDGGVEFTAWF
ncbi:MAG: HAMP domain-containing protein [Lachnospiraceae bacterium]|nr:HAMP domain-containing protein [Lachnospiraceae bacterium]